MLSVIVYEDTARIKIRGTRDEFKRDLKVLHSIPAVDRKFDRRRGEWIVKNITNYSSVAAISAALDDRKRQLELPLEA